MSPNTNWVAICGQNAAPNLVLVNGINKGTSNGGAGGRSLQINVGGCCASETSEWGVAEVIAWERALDADEIGKASNYLSDMLLEKGNLGQNIGAIKLDARVPREKIKAWYVFGSWDKDAKRWKDVSGKNAADATLTSGAGGCVVKKEKNQNGNARSARPPAHTHCPSCLCDASVVPRAHSVDLVCEPAAPFTSRVARTCRFARRGMPFRT